MLMSPPVRALQGRRRAFPTAADAAAYDAGWALYPQPTMAVRGSPVWMGWDDHRGDDETFAAMDDCCAWAASNPGAIGLRA